ncbi:MAG: hypothetical protein U0X76_10980 [Bacteroidia bacterium]
MKALKSISLWLCGAALITSVATLSSCKKDKVTDDDFETTAADIGQAESISTDADNMTAQVARTGTFSHQNSSNSQYDQFHFGSCATVTNDSINHILTFDFGSGCVGADGKTRAGRVIVNYTGAGYFDPGAEWTMNFDSFYVNSRHVEGTRHVVNNGFNANNNLTWTITATNMKVTRTDGSWRTWNSTRTREMTAGYGDSTWVNDIYVINGTANGSNSNGETVDCILTNIQREMSCHWITSGTLTITPSSKPARTIDFGNGSCDDQATVTKNGITRTITLRP